MDSNLALSPPRDKGAASPQSAEQVPAALTSRRPQRPWLEPLSEAITHAVAASAGPEALAAVAAFLEARLVELRCQVEARQFQPRPVGRMAPGGKQASVVQHAPGASAKLRLMTRFGLTPAEARIVVHLADGRTLRDVADHTGVRASTLRSQLQTVFDKTGVRRQSALVALVLREETGAEQLY